MIPIRDHRASAPSCPRVGPAPVTNQRGAAGQGDDFSLAQMPEVFLFLADVRNRMVHIGKTGAVKIMIP